MHRTLQWLGNFLLPPVCPFCRESLHASPEVLCDDCERQMPSLPERLCGSCGGPNASLLALCDDCRAARPDARPWQLAATAFPYTGNLRTAIHQYKFRGNLALAPWFGKRMADAWQRQTASHDAPKPEIVTYIPLFLLRYLQRGYNQSALLAKFVSRRLLLPMACTLLRTRWTAQQARLSSQQRQHNLQHAFTPWRPARWAGKNILLLDDVFTTGETLASAARTLLQSGAASVSVLTIARD